MVSEVATNTKITEPITFDALYETYVKFRNQFSDIPRKFKVAPNVYFKFVDMEIEEQRKRLMEGVKSMPPELIGWKTVFGIEIEVDPTLKPGTWKIVK